METVVLNRFESKMWVNRIVLNSLQCNRIIDCGKLLGAGGPEFESLHSDQNRCFCEKQRFFATFLKFIRTSVLVIILAFVESAKLYNILAQEVNEMG